MTWSVILAFLTGVGFCAAALLFALRHYAIREEQSSHSLSNPHEDDPRLSAVLNAPVHEAEVSRG